MRTRKTNRVPIQTDDLHCLDSARAQTTLRLPRRLYQKAKLFAGKQNAGSVNDFIVSALSAYVRAIERKAIDDSFKGMADDKEYQRETLQIMNEFAFSDAETVALSKRNVK